MKIQNHCISLGIIYEESSLLKIPAKERLNTCSSILKNDKDESLRCEAIWVVGKTANQYNDDKLIRDQIANLLEYVLRNDDNDIVKHEACFQLGEHKMKEKVSALLDAAMNDSSEIVRHEATEALGLMQAFECREAIKKILDDSNSGVRQTAILVLKQLDRLEKARAVNPV